MERADVREYNAAEHGEKDSSGGSYELSGYDDDELDSGGRKYGNSFAAVSDSLFTAAKAVCAGVNGGKCERIGDRSEAFERVTDIDI